MDASSSGDGAEAKHGFYLLIKSFETSIHPMSASSCTQGCSGVQEPLPAVIGRRQADILDSGLQFVEDLCLF